MDVSPSLYESSLPRVSVKLNHGDAYVLSLANFPEKYAALASSPSNRIDLLDKRSLHQIQSFVGHEQATTSIRTVDHVLGMSARTLISSGKDGSVKVWDERSGSHAIKLTNMGNSSRGILSCDVSSDGTMIAAGTEIQGEDAFILYWDPRRPAAPLFTHSSTHSDDITVVSFAPTPTLEGSERLLLSGSTDGLLSISNANEEDEDEAILQVGAWGTSISQAGWYHSLSSNKTTLGVWAASDMETFSLWDAELSQKLSMDIRDPAVHGRRTWVTDYLINCHSSSNGCLRVYTGSNEGDAVLITTPPITSEDPNVNVKGRCTLHSIWSKHHVGVVRSLLPDDDNKVIVTGGEDGKICIWDNPSPFPTFSEQSSVENNDGDVSMEMDIDTHMDVDSGMKSPTGRKRDRDHDDDDSSDGKKSRRRR